MECESINGLLECKIGFKRTVQRADNGGEDHAKGGERRWPCNAREEERTMQRTDEGSEDHAKG
jgi:hypothetical protein